MLPIINAFSNDLTNDCFSDLTSKFYHNSTDVVVRSSLKDLGVKSLSWWALQICYEGRNDPFYTDTRLFEVTLAAMHSKCPEQIENDIKQYLIVSASNELNRYSFLKSDARIELCKFYLAVIVEKETYVKGDKYLVDHLLSECVKRKLSQAAKSMLLVAMSYYFNDAAEKLAKVEPKNSFESSPSSVAASSSSVVVAKPDPLKATAFFPSKISDDERLSRLKEKEELAKSKLHHAFDSLKM